MTKPKPVADWTLTDACSRQVVVLPAGMSVQEVNALIKVRYDILRRALPCLSQLAALRLACYYAKWDLETGDKRRLSSLLISDLSLSEKCNRQY